MLRVCEFRITSAGDFEDKRGLLVCVGIAYWCSWLSRRVEGGYIGLETIIIEMYPCFNFEAS